MPGKYLAFDLGAESGRAILGTLTGDRVKLEEIHRFENKQVEEAGHIRWDAQALFDELRTGLTLAAGLGHKDVVAIGVDTWGVDFGLLDRHNTLIANPVVYRDARTNGMVDRAFEIMPAPELYAYTGIQIMQLNTLFQLLSLVESSDPALAAVNCLLFMPDLFSFMLTGEKTCEYTIASTSQLLNATTKVWADEVFTKLSIPRHIMLDIVEPGTKLGQLHPGIARETGLGTVDVISSGGHDTACAVGAIPVTARNWAYISSGTWSLVGVEIDEPIVNERALKNNFTNEGGINGKIRFLRNTMGLWLLQRCQADWAAAGHKHDYDDLVRLAERAAPFQSVINPDDQTFLNPESMLQAIIDFCSQNDQKRPQDTGAFVRLILESLALKYRYIIDMINDMRAERIEVIHIVGGGSRNQLLNQFAANATGLPVIAGPVEATAAGNIISQAISFGELASFDEGRKLVAKSFPLQEYQPRDVEKWDEVYQKARHLFR